MFNVRRIRDLYRDSVGHTAQDIERVDANIVQIETDIAGAGGERFGFVSLYLERGPDGWYVADDAQFARTARRCRLVPQLPPGVSLHGETLVLRTSAGEQALGRGLRQMYTLLKSVHEPREAKAPGKVLALPSRIEEPATASAAAGSA